MRRRKGFRHAVESAISATGALIAGFAGGYLFAAIGAPLPWTLGALTTAALLAFGGSRMRMPTTVRDVARPVIGVLAGSAFTPAAMTALPGMAPAILFVLAFALVTGVLGFLFFRLACGLDRPTAFFAAMPGGLGEFTLLGGSLGGNMRIIALVHTTRVVVLLLSVPLFIQFVIGQDIRGQAGPMPAGQSVDLADAVILGFCGIVGFTLGKRLRIPGGTMIGAMLCSALVHATGVTDAAPPRWLVILVQVVIGSVIGARFAGIGLSELRNAVRIAFAWAGAILVMAIGAALVGALLFQKPLAVILLALVPFGIAEVVVLAYGLGVEVTFIITCQLCRTFSVLSAAPAVFRLLQGRDAGR